MSLTLKCQYYIYSSSNFQQYQSIYFIKLYPREEHGLLLFKILLVCFVLVPAIFPIVVRPFTNYWVGIFPPGPKLLFYRPPYVRSQRVHELLKVVLLLQ